MQEFRIRSATEQDIPVILSLIRGLAEYEKAAHEVRADEFTLRESLFGAKPSAEVLLVFIGDVVAGFAVYFYNFSTWHGRPGLYLEDLFVRQDTRRRGIGKALLRELARIAKHRGCARMAVLDWNQPAIDFYKSLGAAPMHDWTIFRLTGDAIDRLAEM